MLAVSFLLVASANAQTISSNVEIDNAGALSSDPQGPVSAPSVVSFGDASGSFTVDFSETGFGRAVQRQDGVGAVKVDALFANGQNPNSIRASTRWSDSTTNGTPGPVTYEFSYSITPPALRIGDFAGLPDASNNAPEVSYSLVIRANGAVVFESGAALRGGSRSHTLTESGTSLGPVFTSTSSSRFGYDFGGRSDVLVLGTFGPGETVTVEYEMVAELVTPGFEAGGSAEVGDPFDLDGTPGFTGQFLADGVVATEDASWGELKRAYD